MAETQKKSIFRQSSMERLQSPEQLNDYLHVTNVGIWAVLTVVILLLASFFAWASLGKLETTVAAKASIQAGTARITVIENAQVTPGMTVRIEGAEFRVSEVEKDELGLTVVYAPVNLTDGNYDAVIVIESISPISFLLTA